MIFHKKLGAFIKGHLTRQLFRTEQVKRLIQTLYVRILFFFELFIYFSSNKGYKKICC